jgi:hypothetical protein
MTNWFVVENNTITNVLVSDSKEFLEEQNPDAEIIEHNEYAGIGWIRTELGWRSIYPEDGNEYTWNDEIKGWELVNPIIEEV